MSENQNLEIPQIKPEVNINQNVAQPISTNPRPDNQVQPTPTLNQNPPQPRFFSVKSLTVAGIVILVLFLLLLLPLLYVFQKGKSFYASSQKLMGVAKTQNIPNIKTEIVNTKKSLKSFQTAVKFISWTKIIPFLGGYVKDLDRGLSAAGYGFEAAEITMATAEPYANLLGFGGGTQAEDGTKTTQERIDFFVQAIPSLVPKAGEISDKVGKAKVQLDQINPNRYPVKLGKRNVREPLKKALDLFDQAATFVMQSKPLLEAAPYLLGLDNSRQYLVLFQNDKELRPTGGFMTAYSIMKVAKGKFEPVVSSDIYNLDAKYKSAIPAPEPLIKYIKGPYVLSKNIRLRDMNWSPDFAESMKLFLPEAAKVGIDGVDGVIAVDTQLLVYLLDVIGPIGVPAFGNFSTQIEPKCNCPQVIYELESFADVEGPIVWDPVSGKIVYRPPNSDNRKKIIGPLMNSILANALGQTKEKLPKLFEAGFKSLLEKHVLFYLNDNKAQTGVEAFGIAGKLKSYDGDYLHINDANLGGRKSNMYVTQDVEQDIVVARDGSVEKTIVITYKNPEKQDGWLNSVLPNWVRVYVPKGSQLIAAEGLEEKAEPYEDLDKTVFAGFFKLRPEGVSKVTLKYKLPFKVKGDYKLLVQKQPGTDAPLYTVKLGKQEDESFLKMDKEYRLRI